MTLLPMSPLVWAGSLLAGFLGALTGLGGGVVVVPLLVLVFGVDLRYAIGASLLSVVGTSSGAAAAYLRDGVSNIRVGMFLEIATTIGALVGAAVAAHAAKDAIAVVFGLVLLAAAATSLTRRTSQAGPSPAASRVARGRRTRRGDDLPGRDGQGMTMLRWSDGQVERFMAGLLRAGVYLSAALVLAGGAVHLAAHAGGHPGFGVFRGEPRALRGMAGIAREAVALDGRGIIQLGLLVLVATPVARVAFSVLAFAARRDWPCVPVTLAVLGILGFSLLGAHP